MKYCFNIADKKSIVNISQNISRRSLNGKWESIKVENFDGYLRELGKIIPLNRLFLLLIFIFIGIPFLKRQLALTATSSLVIFKNNHNWNIIGRMHLPLGLTLSSFINCTNGVEFDYGLIVFQIFSL